MQKRVLSVRIDGQPVDMELDTGAPCSIISAQTLRSIKSHFTLQATTRRFASYMSHGIWCIGRILVNVTIGSTTRKLYLYVVEGHFDTLLGKEWISHFSKEINFTDLFSTSTGVHALAIAAPQLSAIQHNHLNQLLRHYEDVFSEVPGKLVGPPAKVHWKQGASPVFARVREIPLALRNTPRRLMLKLHQDCTNKLSIWSGHRRLMLLSKAMASYESPAIINQR